MVTTQVLLLQRKRPKSRGLGFSSALHPTPHTPRSPAAPSSAVGPGGRRETSCQGSPRGAPSALLLRKVAHSPGLRSCRLRGGLPSPSGGLARLLEGQALWRLGLPASPQLPSSLTSPAEKQNSSCRPQMPSGMSKSGASIPAARRDPRRIPGRGRLSRSWNVWTERWGQESC